MRIGSAIFVFLLTTVATWAHGDVHMYIREITKQLRQDRGNLELLQKRGELFMQANHFQKAIRDFKKCISKGVPTARLHYCLAKSFKEKGTYEKAEKVLRSGIGEENFDQKCLLLMAEISNAQSEFLAAAGFYQLVIEKSHVTTPSLYLNLAKQYKLIGDSDKAISAMRKGLNELGMIPGLYENLIKEYLSTDQIDRAIHLQTKIIKGSNRKEFALLSRAKMFMKIQKMDEAWRDIIQAESEIEKLPDHIRKRQAVATLKQNLNTLRIKHFDHENHSKPISSPTK